MKHIALSLLVLLAVTTAPAADIVVVTSATSVTINGVGIGKPADAIANNPRHAPAIQRALEAWAADMTAANASLAAERDAAKAALSAETARVKEAIAGIKAKANTAAGKKLIDDIKAEVEKPEKARRKAAIEAEIAAKQAELSKLNSNP